MGWVRYCSPSRWLGYNPGMKGILLLAAALTLGTAVPDFSARAIDGGAEVKLSELRKGKDDSSVPVVVSIWSFKCPSGAASMEKYKAVAEAVEKKGAKFVALCSYGEGKDKIAAFAKEKGLTYRLLEDDGTKAADVFGAEAVTETYVVDKDGKLAYHGGLDGAEAAVDDILAGKPVSKAETKFRG
jgi:peroxiredoxin